MKLLQINTSVNTGSTGRIAEDIGIVAMEAGWESYIAAQNIRPSQSKVIPVGNKTDRYVHALQTRLFDNHGFASAAATRQLADQIRTIDPDIIHLHNLHGYYLHVGILFEYLAQAKKPVVWTFHDCWPFTGHCSYFDRVNCYRWQTECHHCPNKHGYPASMIIDNSKNNYSNKRNLFNYPTKMTLAAPCRWMENNLRNSFLNNYAINVIPYGISLDIFNPTLANQIIFDFKFNKKSILGVANIWNERKGLKDFIQLRELLSDEVGIILVGLSKKQINGLPEGIRGIERTESTHQLAALYAQASVFVNPTYVDNFPTVNLEALACGTPVVTYQTGGSPEAVDEHTGMVVPKGDVEALKSAIETMLSNGKMHYRDACWLRAEQHFDKHKQNKKYLEIYQQLLNTYS